MPKVSICVPIYDMKDGLFFLKRNLTSVFSQTFRDFQVVISDDSEDSIKDWLYDFYLEHSESHPETPSMKYVKNKGKKGMAYNTNNALDNADGELVKILFQDDYFYNEASLWDIVKHFTPYTMWMITPCTHSGIDGKTFNDHTPFFSQSENTLGSPSTLTMRGQITDRFNPEYKWVLDLDFYKRLFEKYGLPKITNNINVVIGIGDHQQTHILTEEEKKREHLSLIEKT